MKPTLVLFAGGMGGSPEEEMVAQAQRAAALDTLEAALSTGAFGGAVLATAWKDLGESAPPGVILDFDHEPFHFGRRLAEVIDRYRIERPVYLGAGSAVLFRPSDFAAIARPLAEHDRVVISNNFYSADLVAFTPGSAIHQVPLPDRDNPLPRLLRDHAGLANQPLPRTLATMFDIDGPTDLQVLALTGLGGQRLRAVLAALPLDLDGYRRTLACFVDPAAEVVLAGRVTSQVWQYMERETACRVRVFSEERGMQAAGRDRDETARSLLGFYLAEVGCKRFFAALGELGNAAVIDTRVILAHMRRHPARADRFRSDLGRWQAIADPFLREFTRAALSAPIPIVLGGHSLITGGLMALVEYVWQEHDRAQGKPPPP
jgi:hypothetical protein